MPVPATLYNALSFVGSNACYYDYMQDTEIFPKSERLSFLGRANFALDANTTLFVEGLLSQTKIVHMIRTQKVPFFQSRAVSLPYRVSIWAAAFWNTPRKWIPACR